MRARDIVGRRVVAVRQFRNAPGGSRNPTAVIDYIELEGGVRLHFGVAEQEDDYGVYGIVTRRPRAPKHEGPPTRAAQNGHGG